MWKLLQTQDSLKNLDPFVHNNRNGSVYLHSQFSHASPTRNTTLGKRFPSLNFRHPPEEKGYPKFRLKDSSG